MNDDPYEIAGQSRTGRCVCIADHAHNTVPDFVANGDLGISPEDMGRHIAYDIGAAGVTRALAEQLDGPAVLSNFSRLVIDPNRGEDDPTLIMQLYDGTVIPANRGLCADAREARLDRLYRPYHNALGEMLERREAPVLISIHSFTPQLKGREARPWHIGVLSAQDRRLADPLLSRLGEESDLCFGDNVPYSGALPGDTMDRHALRHARPHILIELRNDLISTAETQQLWASRLAGFITDVLERTGH